MLLIVMGIVIVIISLINPQFLTAYNLIDMLRSSIVD